MEPVAAIVRMRLDPEQTGNQIGEARQRPELGGIAVGLWPSKQRLGPLLLL